ncbi:MATE family efflux transporter [Nostoc sp.]|uniref:MATE family efflux transporter n=1 Tax=Nostoc sp. TaxID=1180 RepID=UPI003FA60BA8
MPFSFCVSVAILYIVFPENIFGLLTNHTEITENIVNYLFWLLPCQGFCAISLIVEGYFIGLTEGKTLRNSALVSLGVGFAPVAIFAWYFYSNHLLWLAFVLSQIVSIIVFGVRLIEDFGNRFCFSYEC